MMPRPIPSPEFLTVRQVCARLGICLTTGYRLVETGEIAVLKIGRALRIPASAIDEFVEKNTTRPPT